MEIERRENANGGKGTIFVKRILNEEELNGKCKMFAEVTIPAGCSLGYHVHSRESETYYIVKGQGEYNDNGTTRFRMSGLCDRACKSRKRRKAHRQKRQYGRKTVPQKNSRDSERSRE